MRQPEGNRRILLVERPHGAPETQHFRLETVPVPKAADGEVVVRTVYLSLDPYMRGRMSDAPSYAPSVGINEVMTGGTVGRVVESRHPDFAIDDYVFGYGGWQDYACLEHTMLRKLDPEIAPLPTALGVLGMPGLTAYAGLHEIARPRAGETLVVAAAAGAVGSLVGQLAKRKGCRTVGIAGSEKKCALLVDTLGFDAAVNYRRADVSKELSGACPNGIDIYWENVGGPIFDAVLPLLNPFARVPVCGLIHWYNATSVPTVPDPTPRLMRSVLINRLTIRGFIVFDFADLESQFLDAMGAWLREGNIRYQTDVRQGLEQAPAALAGLLQGENVGKLIIQVSPDPTRK